MGNVGCGQVWGVLSGRDPADRCTIEAGKTRVAYDYWLAVERPELFMPIDKRDTRTIEAHSRNLDRTRHELERGRPRASGPGRPRSGVLPPRTGGSTLKLSGQASGR